jgi:hypothetical protein
VAIDFAWWQLTIMLLSSVTFIALAFGFARQGVAFTDEVLRATGEFRPTKVAWGDIERVHLDWAAEAAGRDRDVLRIERTDGRTIRLAAVSGTGSSRGDAARLEDALRFRGRAHGFEVEVSKPSWMEQRGAADQ